MRTPEANLPAEFDPQYRAIPLLVECRRQAPLGWTISTKRTLGEFESPARNSGPPCAHSSTSNAMRHARRPGSILTETHCWVGFLEQIMPGPLGENSVSAAVALDVLHWRGSGDG